MQIVNRVTYLGVNDVICPLKNILTNELISKFHKYFTLCYYTYLLGIPYQFILSNLFIINLILFIYGLK